MEDPAARATRTVTRVASGAMVWRAWGAGPPLVLLHGASGSWTHWIRNVLPLAERFRVLAPDMPGYGESDAPPEPHTADRLADLVTAGIDQILRRHRGKRIFLEARHRKRPKQRRRGGSLERIRIRQSAGAKRQPHA